MNNLFKKLLYFHNFKNHESSLYFAYQIGFYLHLFKHHKETFPQMKFHLQYKKAWCYFLIQLFNLLEEYPMLQHSNKSPSFFRRNLVHIRHELFLLSETDKQFWKGISFLHFIVTFPLSLDLFVFYQW
jgi:hypothetical protein